MSSHGKTRREVLADPQLKQEAAAYTRTLRARQHAFDNAPIDEMKSPDPVKAKLDMDLGISPKAPPPGFQTPQPKIKKVPPMSAPLKQTGLAGAGGEEYVHSQENVEGVQAMNPDVLVDAIALGTARALANVQPPPTQAPVSGYVGSRNTENADVLNSSATGTNRTPGQAGFSSVPLANRGGDTFASAKESHNSSTDTLRPLFGVAPANGVIPSQRQQVQSDILFSDFSIVAPGHGLGVTNKMFLIEEMRDKKIIYAEPLAEPRKYDGPTDGATPPPLEWQNEITRRDRNILAARAIAEASAGTLLEARAGSGSLNVLGDDFGMFQRVSDKGLKRQADSPFEPEIRLPKAWERVRPLPGIQWARKQARRLFDSVRYPERFEPNVAMEGGPTMNKRNSLATFPFPITSQ